MGISNLDASFSDQFLGYADKGILSMYMGSVKSKSKLSPSKGCNLLRS